MEKSILITGGARSGKSELAERLALRPTGRAIYIATAEAWDDEMRARIKTHQDRRGAEWTNLHAPMDLCSALRDSDGGDPRLVDCLTLWLTNLMLSERDWRAATEQLCDVLTQQSAPVVLVTNEVGAGIVPDNKLARDFRDAAGWLNRRVAEISETVILTVAGCPIKVKPNDTPI
ncbi:bifunctional adenosylcobinamide kinase/adenosylcobinamide-phosphate guanylyltransferase [Sagittula sp. SSi028]|uniref:bifunctional adenosylcobinamide kinase/adenosylcobinamide-phosphate guanylyltransferase n=1 Tax=Sagittula sp. SSi028 TaxID=3400636 RepID=UPI003AF59BA3